MRNRFIQWIIFPIQCKLANILQKQSEGPWSVGIVSCTDAFTEVQFPRRLSGFLATVFRHFSSLLHPSCENNAHRLATTRLCIVEKEKCNNSTNPTRFQHCNYYTNRTVDSNVYPEPTLWPLENVKSGPYIRRNIIYWVSSLRYKYNYENTYHIP